MTALPDPIVRLSSALNGLPGVGPRSSERIALHLVQTDKTAAETLARLIVEANEKIASCQACGGLTEQQPCGLCASEKRDGALICLVESPLDIISIERSGVFKGKYHVLGGRISPLNGVGPEDLRIEALESRIEEGGVEEVIIALGADVEGDATSAYLAKRLQAKGVRSTRIAHGLSAGSGLEFADELTLSKALEGRREIAG